jgi:hypothetical protein
MAILAYFAKAAEDSRTVRYRWGGRPEAMDGELTLLKDEARLLEPAETPTIQLMAAARKIVALKMRDGTWPDQGMTAS